MKRIEYEQLIYTSSQKDIITGNSGFGIRTISKGLNEQEAQDIQRLAELGYPISTDRRLTMEDIKNDYSALDKYVPIIRYQQIELPSSEKRYVLSKTVYIAADYGYFCGEKHFERVGTNYISHLLIFKEDIGAININQIVDSDIFIPKTYSCDPNDETLRNFLGGEPQLLESGELLINESNDSNIVNYKNLAYMTIGLLSSYDKKDSDIQDDKIICKIHSDEVYGLLHDLRFLPAKLTDRLFIYTDYPQDSSYPLGFNLIFINQSSKYNLSNTDRIVVDCLSEQGKLINVESNYIFSQIEENAAKQDFLSLKNMVEFYLSCNDKEDLQHKYELYQLISSEAEVTNQQLKKENLDNILKLSESFNKSERDIVIKKINDAINKPFNEISKSSEHMVTALKAIDYFKENYPSELVLQQSSKQKFLSIIFNGSENLSQFLKFIKPQTVLYVIQGLNKPMDSYFWNTMSYIKDSQIWKTFIQYYYGNDTENHLEDIVRYVYTNQVKDRNSLIGDLFSMTVSGERIVKTVLEVADKNNNDDICGIISCYLDNVYSGKSRIESQTVKFIDSSSIELKGNDKRRLSNLVSLINNSVPKDFDTDFIKLVADSGKDDGYCLQMIKQWISVKGYDSMKPALKPFGYRPNIIKEMINCVWQEKMDEDDKEKYTMQLYDSHLWNSDDRKIFIEQCSNEELKELLTENKKIINTVKRKLMNAVSGLLKKSPVLILICILFTGCIKLEFGKIEYETPFKPSFYFLPDDVTTVVDSTFDATGKFVSAELYQFRKDRLIDLHRVTDKNSQIVAQEKYIYNKYGKLRKIKTNDSSVYSGIKYDMSNRFKGYTFTDNTGKYKYKYSWRGYTVKSDDSKEGRRTWSHSDGKETCHETYPKDTSVVFTDYIIDSLSRLTKVVWKNKDSEKDSVYKVKYDTDSTYWHVQMFKDKKNRTIKTVHRTTLDTFLVKNVKHVAQEGVGSSLASGNDVADSLGLSSHGPSDALLVILCILVAVIITLAYIFAHKKYGLFKDFSGQKNNTGVKKLWPFCLPPYKKVGIMFLIALGAVITGILILFIVGGLMYGLLWVFRIILVIIIIFGVILIIGGIICFFANPIVGIIIGVIGIVIVSFDDTFNDLGTSAVAWGFDFMNDLNIFGWLINLFANNWLTILGIVAAPFVLFLAIALLIIIFVGILRGVELAVLAIYKVHRRCPHCGKADLIYMINESKDYPVSLNPGIYGIFHQIYNGNKYPTMLFNGKGKLPRRCPKCHHVINMNSAQTYGTDVHIGFVGNPSMGKSYLIFSGLNELQNRYKNAVTQVEYTDDTDISKKVSLMQRGGDFKTDVKAYTHAIQVMFSYNRPIPYHIYCWDVAGENFDSSYSTGRNTVMDFYKNVRSIVFVIDPLLVDYSINSHPSDRFVKWLEEQQAPQRYDVNYTYSNMKSILTTQGNRLNKIDLTFVLAKADYGYMQLASMDYRTATDADVKRFMTEEMGLINLINIGASFRSVSYKAVSVTDNDKTTVNNLFRHLLTQQKVLS